MSDGTTQLTGKTGVAPIGTLVTMTPTTGPELPAEVGWTQAAPAFDITLSDGLQPATPVAVTTRVNPAEGNGKRLVFITRRSGSDRWEGLPVTLTGATATTRLTHFSGGFFGWVNDANTSFEKGINDYFKLRFDPPACNGKELSLSGATYTSSANGKGVFVCVENKLRSPTLTVHSNSPFVWRIAGPKGTVKPLGPISPVETSGIITLATYNRLFESRLDRETALVPGGIASLQLLGEGPWTMTADVDAALGLVAVAVAGFDMYLGAAKVEMKLAEKAQVGECVAGIIEAGAQPDPGKITRAVIDCFGTVVKGAAAVVVAIGSSLASLLVTQVAGGVSEIPFGGRTPNHLTITVKQKPQEQRDLPVEVIVERFMRATLRGDRATAMRYGTESAYSSVRSGTSWYSEDSDTYYPGRGPCAVEQECANFFAPKGSTDPGMTLIGGRP